jgi:hypothetical protein
MNADGLYDDLETPIQFGPNPTTLRCLICKREFTRQRGWQKTCSKACSRERGRQSRRDWSRNHPTGKAS